MQSQPIMSFRAMHFLRLCWLHVIASQISKIFLFIPPYFKTEVFVVMTRKLSEGLLREFVPFLAVWFTAMMQGWRLSNCF